MSNRNQRSAVVIGGASGIGWATAEAWKRWPTVTKVAAAVLGLGLMTETLLSFPNYIPLSAAEVDHVLAAVRAFHFDRIYGAWWDRNVASDAKNAVLRSAERYKRALL